MGIALCFACSLYFFSMFLFVNVNLNVKVNVNVNLDLNLNVSVVILLRNEQKHRPSPFYSSLVDEKCTFGFFSFVGGDSSQSFYVSSVLIEAVLWLLGVVEMGGIIGGGFLFR